MSGRVGDAVERTPEQPTTDLVFKMPAELFDQLVAEVTERALAQAAERLRLEREPYLTTKEAAAYMSCKPQRIHELTSAGRLPHVKDGSRLLFRRADLDDYLRAHDR